MKAKDILKIKGSKVYTISQETTLKSAASRIFANKIGSILVTDEMDEICGILTPVDILEAIHLHCEDVNCALEKVKTVMTTNMIIASEEDDIEDILAMMSENRVRHIPIMDKKECKGLISIGDILATKVQKHEVEVHHLIDYIEGKYPG